MEERYLNDLERKVLLESERNDLEVEKLVFEKVKAKQSIYSLAFSKKSESQVRIEHDESQNAQLEVLDATMDITEAAAEEIAAASARKRALSTTPRTLHIQNVTTKERALEEEVRSLNSALQNIWADGERNRDENSYNPTPAPLMPGDESPDQGPVHRHLPRGGRPRTL